MTKISKKVRGKEKKLSNCAYLNDFFYYFFLLIFILFSYDIYIYIYVFLLSFFFLKQIKRISND